MHKEGERLYKNASLRFRTEEEEEAKFSCDLDFIYFL
jgi:hypothetical protein